VTDIWKFQVRLTLAFSSQSAEWGCYKRCRLQVNVNVFLTAKGLASRQSPHRVTHFKPGELKVTCWKINSRVHWHWVTDSQTDWLIDWPLNFAGGFWLHHHSIIHQAVRERRNKGKKERRVEANITYQEIIHCLTHHHGYC